MNYLRGLPQCGGTTFSLEIYRTWGPAASDFFGQASAHIRDYRDVNYFHW
eukprot:SAG22_NODE_4630_length_1211_cov_1.462230_1_plen_49_part_10